MTLVATILGSSIAILDSSVVSVALPSIQRSLGGGLAGQQWVSNAYLLTLGDIFGERRVFALGVGGFGAASSLRGAKDLGSGGRNAGRQPRDS